MKEDGRNYERHEKFWVVLNSVRNAHHPLQHALRLTSDWSLRQEVKKRLGSGPMPISILPRLLLVEKKIDIAIFAYGMRHSGSAAIDGSQIYYILLNHGHRGAALWLIDRVKIDTRQYMFRSGEGTAGMFMGSI